MRLNKVSISNIMGLKELIFEPGSIVEISGQNGSGKTSVIESIKAALQGGNDATLLRNGAEKGEIVLELDSGMTITKTVKGKSSTTVTDSTGRKMPQPQTELDRLYDLFSVNPIQFLTAKPDKRAEVLLETLKIEVTDEELGIDKYCQEILDKSTTNYSQIEDGLERIEKIHDTLYEKRTTVNSSIKDKKTTIEQLNKSIEGFDVVPGVIEAQIEELANLQKARLTAKEERNTEYLNERDSQLNEIEEERAKILAELDERKQKAVAEYQAKKDDMYSRFELVFNKSEQELSVLRSKMQQIGAINNTLEIISSNEAELEILQENAESLNTNLDRIKAVKLSKLANLPIKGLEIQGKNIFIDGVPFDRVNTAKQISIAVEVAKLRAGELGIICVDGIERLDTNTFTEFKKQIEMNGKLQVFVTKVDDNPELQINSDI